MGYLLKEYAILIEALYERYGRYNYSYSASASASDSDLAIDEY